MKRDMDLVRKLLIHFEDYNSFAAEEKTVIEGYSEDLISYHLILMAQAGLIVFEPVRSSTNPERFINVYPFGLSWTGHEFLDQVRDDTIWNKAKQKVGEATGGVSLALLQAVVISSAKHALGLD